MFTNVTRTDREQLLGYLCIELRDANRDDRDVHLSVRCPAYNSISVLVSQRNGLAFPAA